MDKDKAQMFNNVIAIARRAPLANMEEAEAVAALLKQFAEYAKKELEANEAE